MQPSVTTIRPRVTPRTRAVMVVHLAGYPAPVDEIVEFCAAAGIGVVEDCAQSWGARLHGRLVGSFGTAGAYSTNDFKHISTGDGGFTALRDADLYRRVSNFADKYYDRLFDQSQRQRHYALNYRMSELLGAVAVAQLEKVDQITARYHAIGVRFEQALAGLPGARLITGIPGSYSTYWWSLLICDPARLAGTRNEVVKALQAEGLKLGSYGTYDLIQKPLFTERVTRPWLADARRHYPFVQPDGREYRYDIRDVPNHRRLLETGIMMEIKGCFSDADVEETIAGIWKVFRAFAK